MLTTASLLHTLALLTTPSTAFPADTPTFTDPTNSNNINNVIIRQVSCAPTHLIIARASLEASGPGIIGALAEQILAANPGATNESIAYPATLDDYQDSSAQGTAAMARALTEYAGALLAIIQMGDPRFVAGKSFDAGNSKRNGLFPRPANISCDAYGDRIRSYCDEGDTYCAGGNNTLIHVTYLDRYTDDAVDFVNSKLAA
ncbi:Carboxyl transferase [Macrophomina phaseolina MS6]|uniref:Carboxyl transferase n=1 Tax=Macrophomina phaseolina (strain MS6) TaxID=1126212 RepID=K2QSN8_MACPH|nr:Carboxyl transferase [Macrophomina phaseolina MS6]